MAEWFNLNTGEVYDTSKDGAAFSDGYFKDLGQWVKYDKKVHEEGKAGLADPNGFLKPDNPMLEGALEDRLLPEEPQKPGKNDIASGPTGSKSGLPGGAANVVASDEAVEKAKGASKADVAAGTKILDEANKANQESGHA